MLDYNIFGAGESLVLNHGALVSQSMWQSQVGEFSKYFQVITLDLPAHGSVPDGKRAYTIEVLAQYGVVRLNSLNISQAHVCGHSLAVLWHEKSGTHKGE